MKRTQRFIALILALITITSIAVVPAAADTQYHRSLEVSGGGRGKERISRCD